jgi:serine/threonine protein kinase
MDPTRWQQARALFDVAADLPASEWDALLEARCADASIRAEARALLEADRDARATAPMSGRAPDLLAALAEDQVRHAAEALVGRHFGAWRLLGLIGQGGMGAVYLAERAEGGFQQRAALKLVRPGPGMDDLAQRFRTERQILAGLEHPNIARLLDGGAGPQGEPFLALEYVEGRELRAHCDAMRLDLRARLALFLTVCDAVDYAHARLVVHRDLKPGNLLVTADGTLKLLDFGVAKLVDRVPGAEATIAHHRLYTPEYAAPEQIRGETTTTAVDVHALGVILFELLTGRRPFGGAGQEATAIEHLVLRQDAPRPSSLITRRPDPLLRRAAESRRATPAQLRTMLRGDLDHIVQRALRKRPEDRYPSARAFADDVRAWLERRPVTARRGSTRYRTVRFVQRHRVATGLAGAALAALVVGLGAAVWQAGEARAQRDLARSEAEKARAALGFMTGLFTLADPEVAQGERVTARELLEQGTERIRTELRGQPAARAELLHAIGQAHLGLGLYAAAMPLLDEAAAGGAGGAPGTLARTVVRHELGRYPDALALLEPERARLATASPGGSPALAQVDLRLAMVLQSLNRLQDADAAYRRVLAFQRARLGAQHPDTRRTELRYASLLVLQDRDDEARGLSEGIVAALRADPATDPTLLARALGAHAMVVSNTGPQALAETLRREQLALCERIYGAEHPLTLGARNDLATVLFTQQRYVEARPLFEAVLEARRGHFGPDHPAVATAANNLSNTWLALEDPARALAPAEDALRIRTATHGEQHHTTAMTLRTVATVEMMLGRMPQARALLERSVAAYARSLGPDHRSALGSINDLVRTRIALRDPDPGCALAHRAIALSRADALPEAPESHYQFALLAACRVSAGDPAARAALESASLRLDAAFGADDRRSRIVADLLRLRPGSGTGR